MTIIHGYSGKRPVLYAAVRCLQSSRHFVTRFLLDTGACQTCLPAHRAIQWGHNNDHPDVKPFAMEGVEGNWSGFYHSFAFGLLDGLRGLAKPPVWEASLREIAFLTHLETEYGLLGMDVIHEWKELKIVPKSSGDGGAIHILV